MPLFHPNVMNKVTAPALEIPPAHTEILAAWAESITGSTIHRQKETALAGLFREKIMTGILGYQPFGSKSYDVHTEYPLAGNRVDLALGVFDPNDPAQSRCLAPFELKGAKTKLDVIMPGRNKTPVQQAWDYAMDAKGAKWVLVSNYLKIRLYAVGYGRQDYEEFDLAKLTDLAEYTRFYQLLCKENFLGGQTKTWLKESERQDKKITNALYRDYKALRLHLIRDIAKHNPALDKSTAITYAQILLDRALFIAFAEDKGLLPDNSLKKAYEYKDPYAPRSVWETYKSLFTAINQGSSCLNIPKYNGGLFAENAAINDLTLSDRIFEGFKKLSEYDFQSEISVTILGHIFEQSITDLEALHKGLPIENARRKDGKRKKEGVVYTPPFITAFIVEQTVGGWLQERKKELGFENLPEISEEEFSLHGIDIKRKNFTEKITPEFINKRRNVAKKVKKHINFWEEYQKVLKNIKIVDPACGSGAFLVAAFDYLHTEYILANNLLAELRLKPTDVFDPDKEILTHNLFGVDINSESIEITKLSLWLKTAKRGKVLNTLDDNFCWGDSLIDDTKFSAHAFTWQKSFPDIFKNGGFDVVLGNPPYVRQEFISLMKPYLEKNFKVYEGTVDLYAYFFELGLHILKPDGRMGYICSSTFFKTGSGQKLRTYLKQNAALETIVDFGDLQVFEDVTTYTAIMVMEKGTPEKANSLNFIKVKELPDNLSQLMQVEGKPLLQSTLKDDSWQLEGVDLQTLREKITKKRKTLKEVYGSPMYGIKTGYNKAFVIDAATRDRLIKEDAKSAELIKPLLEGKDIQKWHIQPKDKFLIFTRRGIDIKKYPAIKAYLKQFKERLTPKPKDWLANKKWQGRKLGSYKWFEIQDNIAYHAEFDKPKIIYGHFSVKALFSLDKNCYYSNDKSYIIPDADYFLLGILQSNISWLLLMLMCPFVRGGYYEVRIYFTETLPIPATTPAQKKKIGDIAEACQKAAEERYALQEKVRNRLADLTSHRWNGKLSKKLNNWWALDFKAFQTEVKKVFKRDIPVFDRDDWQKYLFIHGSQIADLTAQIEKLESSLNKEVYALFALTPEEIRLVEENV